jgi:hypothetical protein
VTLRFVLNVILLFITYYKYLARLVSFNITGAEYGVFVMLLLYIFWKFNGKLAQVGHLFLVGIFCAGTILNAALSMYVENVFQYSFSAMVYLFPILIYIVFSSIKIDKICVRQQLKDFSVIILGSIIHSWLTIKTLGSDVDGPLPSGFVPHKDIGYVGVWCSIMCLYAYSIRKTQKYYSLFIFLVCILFILDAKLLKSFLAVAVGISCYYISDSRFNLSRIYGLVLINIIGFSVIVFNEEVRLKLIEYYQFYFTDNNALDAPRTALYVASFKMFKDYFPWGIGIGTFGSYGAIIYDSLVYFDYGLTGLHGLNNLVALDTNANFLMDVFWSSAVGELGLINMVIYLVLISSPVYQMYQSSMFNLDTKRIVLLSFLLIAIQSMVLAVFIQISFVFFVYCLAGLSVARR